MEITFTTTATTTTTTALLYSEGPRTQIIGFQGPTTMMVMVFGL